MIKPLRGEIWWVDFDPSVGDEIQKNRTAAVVSLNTIGKLDLRIVVPITGWNATFTSKFWMVRIKKNILNGLTKDSAADCFQVKSVSVDRFSRKLGSLTDAELEEICAAVQICIGAI